MQRDILPPMGWSRCWLWAGAACMAACVQFHPRNPPWQQPQPAAATAPAPAGPPAEPAVAAVSDLRDGPVAPNGPVLVWSKVGESVQGRPLRAATIGQGPRRVLWIGGIHGNEREGRIATAELPAAFAARPGALAAVTLMVLEDCNPDGSARHTRGNSNGVDLNRNFPAPNFRADRSFGTAPLSQPESRAVHDLVLQFRPHLVIVAHSWSNDRFINFDGPQYAARLAERFSRLSGYPVRESEDIAPTPGSLGSWLGRTRGTPILTLEYRRGREPRAAWLETRVAILAAILDEGDEVAWRTTPTTAVAARRP